MGNWAKKAKRMAEGKSATVFVKARQQQLDESVHKAWAAVPVGLIEQPARTSA